jgi:hypothetical protein
MCGVRLYGGPSVVTRSIEFGIAANEIVLAQSTGSPAEHPYSGAGMPKSLLVFRTSCFLISRCRGTVLLEPVFEFL